MHDPLTVAFAIPRPWPKRDSWKTETAAKQGVRWQFRNTFWVVAGRGIYWPNVVTVWHRDPSGYDSTTCKTHPGHGWRFHVHHWRIQVIPLQRLRRRLLTRCAWCGGPDRKGDSVCVSRQWDGPRGHWWRGEPGLYHPDCEVILSAHNTCTCEHPVLAYDGYGMCARCSRSRSYGMTDEHIVRALELQTIPEGARTDPTGPAA